VRFIEEFLEETQLCDKNLKLQKHTFLYLQTRVLQTDEIEIQLVDISTHILLKMLGLKFGHSGKHT
jgi:hypothetical protein